MTTVTHATPHPAVADSGDGRISKNAWEEGHLIVDLRVIVTTLVNYVINDGVPLYFHETRDDNDGAGGSTGIWVVGEPDRFIIQSTILQPNIQVHLTTLGTNYTGPDNSDVVVSVLKNWDQVSAYLDSTIAAQRFSHGGALQAQLDVLNQDIEGPLVEGDILQVVLAGPTGSLLVESNASTPPDVGTDYRTQPGTGDIGTRFVLRG